jgi:hypothetical protein
MTINSNYKETWGTWFLNNTISFGAWVGDKVTRHKYDLSAQVNEYVNDTKPFVENPTEKAVEYIQSTSHKRIFSWLSSDIALTDEHFDTLCRIKKVSEEKKQELKAQFKPCERLNYQVYNELVYEDEFGITPTKENIQEVLLGSKDTFVEKAVYSTTKLLLPSLNRGFDWLFNQDNFDVVLGSVFHRTGQFLQGLNSKEIVDQGKKIIALEKEVSAIVAKISALKEKIENEHNQRKKKDLIDQHTKLMEQICMPIKKHYTQLRNQKKEIIEQIETLKAEKTELELSGADVGLVKKLETRLTILNQIKENISKEMTKEVTTIRSNPDALISKKELLDQLKEQQKQLTLKQLGIENLAKYKETVQRKAAEKFSPVLTRKVKSEEDLIIEDIIYRFFQWITEKLIAFVLKNTFGIILSNDSLEENKQAVQALIHPLLVQNKSYLDMLGIAPDYIEDLLSENIEFLTPYLLDHVIDDIVQYRDEKLHISDRGKYLYEGFDQCAQEIVGIVDQHILAQIDHNKVSYGYMPIGGILQKTEHNLKQKVKNTTERIDILKISHTFSDHWRPFFVTNEKEHS